MKEKLNISEIEKFVKQNSYLLVWDKDVSKLEMDEEEFLLIDINKLSILQEKFPEISFID